MNTVHTLTKQLTNPHAIMEKVTDLLRDLDPDYAGEEKAFQNACNRLTEEIGEFLSPSAQEYLRALEEEFVSDILFVTYQGFHLNLDIFRDPVHALALQFDYEDLHQERRMPTLPMADRAIQTSSAFLKVLRASHPDKLNLLDDVKDFYDLSASTVSNVEVAAEMQCLGHAPTEPKLCYLQREPSIQSLITLRMDKASPMLHQKYTLKLSNSSGIKEKDAVKIDAALKAMKISGNTTVINEAQNESRRFFEYEIDF